MNILPTFRQLRYLVAVVDLRHFGQAAERCHVTQSTLSAGLKDLEDLLQATLVERTKRKVLPTPLGETVAEQARALLAGAANIVETARSDGAPLSGPFRLGTIPTIGPFILPRVLHGLRLAYPDLKLFLREDQTKPLLEKLKKGDLDAVLIALPYDVSDFDALSLGDDPFWLAAPPDHPLIRSRRATVSASDVEADEVLLLEDGHCLREHALSACRLNRATGGEDGFQATSLYTLVEMVANHLGVTFLPEIALSAGLVKGTDVSLKPLTKDSPPRHIGLVWRKSFHREDDVAALGAYLKGRMAGLKITRRQKAP
ncbi:MAG: hydrogen peroxide-inducible genes activator [Rhodospirillales bacterium]|nr:hydrogen peroxide-inducible genes activator [Rhodospirillales bacterium]